MKNSLLARANHWWGDVPVRWKGATVLLIPVTALICGFASIYVVNLKENDAETWLTHSASVRYHIQEVLNTVVDAETAVRGFVISRNSRFLELYETSLQAFPRRTRELSNLVADNPSQARRAKEIKDLAQERLDLIAKVLAETKNAAQNGVSQPAVRFIAQEEELMGRLRPKITTMDEEESRLQEFRNHALQTDRDLFASVVRWSTVLGILGGVLGLVLFSDGIARRVKNIQANAERLAKEQPLQPPSGRQDEIGKLSRRLVDASNLLREKQQALRESESRLQAVLDNAPSIMYVKDLNGRFILVNRALASVLDRTPSDIVGKTGREIYPMEEAKVFEGNDRAALEAGRALRSEEILQLKDGKHTFISSKFPLLDADGKPYALGGISTDITERARTADALSQAKAEAERASKVKSEFLSRMSHELRTPLHGILGFAQILQRETNSPAQTQSVDYILRSGYHLLKLVNKVLDIARLGSGDLADVDEVFDEKEEVTQPH
jgi:PAS domain S-box-containing protein